MEFAMQEVSFRRGRPRNPHAYRRAQIAVAQAIVEMGRIGGNLPRIRAQKSLGSRAKSRRKGQELPAEFNDDDLAELLATGANGLGIKKLASGSRAIHPATATSAVQKLIESGKLPRRALSPIALDSGHARAMKPFAPLMRQLLRVKIGSAPPPHLQRKVRRIADLHRAAIVDFGRVAKKDRARFREASSQLRGALLALRAAELSFDAAPGDELYRAVATAARALQEALDQLVVSRWYVRTPRYRGRQAVRQMLPPLGANGVPALAPILSWTVARLEGDAVDFTTSIQILRELVHLRWDEDPFSTEPIEVWQEEANAASTEECADQTDEKLCHFTADGAIECAAVNRGPWDRDESLIASDPQLGRLYARAGAKSGSPMACSDDVADRFVRRIVRTAPPGALGTLVLHEIVANWYFQDDEGDSPESEFSDRLRALLVWAERLANPHAERPVGPAPHADGRPVRRGETASKPSWGDMRALLRDLAKIEVRPWVEMNMDVPEALPLEEQWWNASLEGREGGRTA